MGLGLVAVSVSSSSNLSYDLLQFHLVPVCFICSSSFNSSLFQFQFFVSMSVRSFQFQFSFSLFQLVSSVRCRL